MKKKTSLLDRMSSSAMAKMPPPTIHLRGKHAKMFHGHKPGQKVSAQLHGTVRNIGNDPYADNEPTADIEVSHVMPNKKGKQVGPPDDETME